MKTILFITTYNPFEPYSGASQRSRLMLDALTEENQVDLVCFTNEPANNYSLKNCTIKYFGPAYNRTRSKWFKIYDILKFYSIYSLFPKSNHSEKIINQLMHETQYDYVVTRYVRSALMCGITKGENIIIDIDDLPKEWFMTFYPIVNYHYTGSSITES